MVLWLVRCGKYGERERFNLERSIVSIGWEALPDLSAVHDRAALAAMMAEAYADQKPSTLANWVGQVWTFARAFDCVMDEGLRYQELLTSNDPDVEKPQAPLTVEALAVLVNERLAAAGDLGRITIDDVRTAVAYGAHPLVDALRVDGDRIAIETR